MALERVVSFGLEDFTKRFGALKPHQIVDVMGLAGDKADNIPGTLENLLQHVNELEDERLRKAIRSNAAQALLSKNLATLRSDLPHYIVPFDVKNFEFKKPEDEGEKFMNLLRAISAYANGSSAEYIIKRARTLWDRI
ncbi:DNA polymerase I [Nymphaea thermarum]|nr:DNA polymerase I [Nymphaea thermarum]